MSIAPALRKINSYRRHDTAHLVGRMTRQEFPRFEQSTPEKHQYIQGEVVRLPGSSPEHNLIQADFLRVLGNLLEAANSESDIVVSDQKIYISDRTILYPDIAVFCGEPQFDHFDALRNPVVIVEILSPSTEKDDRTDKFADYQTIASLQHYILVEQGRILVTHYEKIAGGLWAIVGTHGTLTEALAIKLGDDTLTAPLSAIYRRVLFQDN